MAANRLFAREYAGKTQLFLEVLPITRARVMATKWLTGAFFQCGLVAAAWLFTLEYMRRTEVITLDDALRPLLAAQAFTLAFWSYAAMAGLLGRYRFIAWAALLLFISFLNEIGSISPKEAPVLRLVNDVSAMARTPVPPGALAEAGVMLAACVVVSLLLGLSGSGSIAATLARRMTSRERVFVIAVGMVFLLLGDRLKKERELPAFELAEAVRSVSSRGAAIGVMTTQELDAAQARALGESVSRDVSTLSAALELRKKIAIFVLPQRGVDRTITQRAELQATDGIVLRAAPDVDRETLRARVLHELISDETKLRGRKEDRHALLDGLSVWWVVQDDQSARGKWWRRAAASAVPLSRTSITRWDETSERVGDCVANALGFALIDTLVDLAGRDRVVALARALFAEPREGAAALLEDSPASLLQVAGTSWDTLCAEAEKRRLAHRGEQKSMRARVEVRDGGDGKVVTAQVNGVERWRVSFGKLGPWSKGQSSLRRLDVRGPQAELPLTLTRGERLLAVIDYDDADLACPVRLEAQRLEGP